MSAEARPRMSSRTASRAYGRALAALEPRHPERVWAIRELTRCLRAECASMRVRMQQQAREIQLLRIELEDRGRGNYE